ncbi:LANO_0H05556g1_1 [Lachancea nothofagi CBS 11611]|uniref:LANO_0H05556g1_1 n=1 Tax=Lachancea nothofagi CBS 11611 TaxID=1266666 RepID=A0A1G4KLJ8_9SACH|nr:LANO_0H05556g1_1 [Lachancea nothofagi CBS 11611]
MKAVVEHVQLQFIPEIDQNVASLRVEQNIMCFALKSGYIFAIDLATPSKVIKYRFPLLTVPQEKILKLWMDPSASSIFLKTNFAKYYVLSRDSMESEAAGNVVSLKRLSKKNCDIISVNWLSETEMLCGSNEGNVYWIDLKSETSITKVYKSSDAVDGVVFSKGKGALLTSGDTIRFWNTAQDPVKTFKGSATEIEQFEHTEKALGKRLTFYNSTFAWIAGLGVVFGTLTNSNDALSTVGVLLSAELPAAVHRIKDIVLSKFHILILRGNEILIVNKLNNEVVAQKSIWVQGSEKMLELTVDYSQDPPTFWCYSSSNIYEIIVKDESAGIWSILTKLGRFDDALKLETLSPLEKGQIYLQKANFLFSQSHFMEAAKCYGKSNCVTTAEVTLKFLNDSTKMSALQTYLATRLDSVKASKNSEVQLILLTNWIVWNYMQMLNAIDESISSEQDVKNLEPLHAQKSHLNTELSNFFEKNINILDRDTIYQIMSHQNRKSEVLTFARLIEDYKYVLSYWIRSKNWYESLKVLITTQDLECIYKYATVLLINSPDSTVNTWMQIPTIDPSELINPLLTYFAKFQKTSTDTGRSRSSVNYALKYLMWCIHEQDSTKPLDTIVFSAGIYMMIAAFDAEDKENEIIAFIETNAGRFDNEFVLRLSTKYKRNKVSTYLYSQMKLFEEAVTLAIEKDLLDDAKLVASSQELDGNLRLKRKLWLKIAKRMICEQHDVKQTIKAILQDSNETLSIKDLLPLFEELTTIANVKEELIRSLKKHNTVMTQVSQEIQDSIKIKKEIAEDIELLKTRFQILEPGVSCNVCEEVLQTRKFYVFPCGHSFHTDCLMREILKSTDYALRNKIEAFQRAASRSKAAVDKGELDQLLSAKCCFCSDIKINSIDEPLDYEETERQAWNV